VPGRRQRPFVGMRPTSSASGNPGETPAEGSFGIGIALEDLRHIFTRFSIRSLKDVARSQ
jgi:hypothetical protein